MDWDTCSFLEKIYKKRSKEFPKICQGLLVLTLQKIGYEIIDNNFSEGVDILCESDGKKYAIEVKTLPKGKQVEIKQEKEIKDWENKKEEGYSTLLAVFKKGGILGDWIICSAENIRAGSYNIYNLKAMNREKVLEEAINKEFPAVVKDNYEGCIRNGLNYLTTKINRR